MHAPTRGRHIPAKHHARRGGSASHTRTAKTEECNKHHTRRLLATRRTLDGRGRPRQRRKAQSERPLNANRTNAQAPKPILTRCENADRTERRKERTLTYWQVSTRRGATDARQSDHLHTPQASRNGIGGRTPDTRRGQDERRRDANAEGANMERCPEGNGTTLQTRRTETRGEPTRNAGSCCCLWHEMVPTTARTTD